MEINEISTTNVVLQDITNMVETRPRNDRQQIDQINLDWLQPRRIKRGRDEDSELVG